MKFTAQNNILFDYMPLRKLIIDPVTATLVTGGIAGGVDLLGNVFSAFGANKQNKQNLNMMREQNAFNAAEADKQRLWLKQQTSIQNAFNAGEAATARDWQEKMIQQQNIFNSPVNQLKRMREAGINPALLEMDGSIRSASPAGNPQASAASVGSPSSASGPGAIPAVNPFSNIGNPALAALQAKKLSAEIESIEDSNQRENEKQPYVIETMKGNIYLIGTDAELNKTSKEALEAQMPLYQSQLHYVNETLLAVKLDNQERQYVLKNWSRKFEAEMDNLEADTGYKLSLTDKTKSEVNKILAETTSIDQANTINSVEFEVVKNNQAALIEMRLNKETNEYDLFVKNANAEKAEAKAHQSKAQYDKLYYDFLNSDTWQAGVHRGLNALSKSIGLSAGVTIPIKK